MSEPMPDRQRPSRPNRLGAGLFCLIQLALILVILLSANYLSLSHHRAFDLTQAGDYSLAPATQNYLAANSLQSREKKIRWIMAYRRSAPLYERVRAVAEEYARRSGGKIELELVDPLRSPDRMEEIISAYGITLVRDLIIIDARLDDRAATREDENRVRTLHANVRLVPADDMLVYTTTQGVRRVSGFKGEDVLTASLVSAVEGRSRKIALIADKSSGNQNALSFSPVDQVREILRYQNIELLELNLSQIGEIPDDVDGVAMIAPAYDLTESESDALVRYWSRPRSALFFLLDDGPVPPRLRALLRQNGVTPRGDRVVSREGGRLITRARGVFTDGMPFLGGLTGLSTEFNGAISSLEVREGAEDLLVRSIQPFGLIEAVPGFWGESDSEISDASYDEVEDHGSPLHLAAAVIRGVESDDRFAADSSRMFVMSGVDFLSPDQARAENLDMLASAANWLIAREELAGIGPRSLFTYKLPLLDAHISFINRLNLVFLPAIFVLTGAIVWSFRRH